MDAPFLSFRHACDNKVHEDWNVCESPAFNVQAADREVPSHSERGRQQGAAPGRARPLASDSPDDLELEPAMRDRRVAELARLAGAEPRPRWDQRLFRALMKKWRSRKPPTSGVVMFVGEDAPRDLDDPLSDPKVQARVGKVIAKKARPPAKRPRQG